MPTCECGRLIYNPGAYTNHVRSCYVHKAATRALLDQIHPPASPAGDIDDDDTDGLHGLPTEGDADRT